jgi:D-alanine-D-alanine ligase-like ATP-grasp enzyme
MDELKIRVQNVLEEFGGALVEQYIDGSEFSVLVVGSNYTKIQTLQPLELKLATTGPAFLTYDEKWHGNYGRWCLIDEKETSLIQELMDLATKLYKAFDGEGSARFDV